MVTSNSRGRWVAIVTGVFSVVIGLIYLMLVTVLDARRSLLTLPDNSGVEEAVVDYFAEEVLPPSV